VAKDLIELGRDKMTAAASTRISFPDGQKNLRRLQVLLTPHSGLYAHASFLFTLIIPPQYPFQPPNVRCHTPCLHPNINWRTGKVYLHLLKAEWKPVLR
jgi:ubiquitin-protein ligase